MSEYQDTKEYQGTKAEQAYYKASDAFEAHAAKCHRCIEDRTCVTAHSLSDKMAKTHDRVMHMERQDLVAAAANGADALVDRLYVAADAEIARRNRGIELTL